MVILINSILAPPKFKRSIINRSLSSQNSIEVIVFVLQKLRKVIFEVPGMFLPVFVFEGKRAVAVASHSDEQVREAETIVPKFKKLIAQIGQHRIDDGISPVGIHTDDPFHQADLGSGDGSSGTVFFAKLADQVM